MRPSKLLLGLALGVLAGCASRPPQSPIEQDRIFSTEDRGAVGGASGPAPGAPGEGEENAGPGWHKAEIQHGNRKFINEDVARKGVADGGPEGDVVFNFESAPVQEVVKNILGDLLQENYVIAPGVGGTVTFSTSKPIRADQAMPILEMLLSWNSATLVYKDGRYTVMPTAAAIPGNIAPRLGSSVDSRGYEVRVFPLEFISPTEMAKLLTPYARQGSIISADTARSMIFMAGTPGELESYERTIETFDVDWLAGMSIGVYTLERVEVATILPEMEKLFGAAGESPLAGMFRFMPIERMNAIIVITPQPKYLDEAESWLKRLDRGGNESGVRLYVYDIKNVKAVDLAEKLNEVFSGSSGGSANARRATGGAVAPGLESVEIRAINDSRTQSKDKSEAKTKTAAAGQPGAPPAAPVVAGAAPGAGAVGDQGINIVESEDIRITAIEENNQLLIKSTPGQFDAILAAIKRLDTIPLQVHIETKIIEVTLDDVLDFGVQWYLEGLISGGRGFESPNNRQRGAVGLGGVAPDTDNALFYSFIGPDIEVAIRALKTKGKAKILSAPSLVVLNNKEASINVGDQIPVVQTFISPFQNFNPPVTNSDGTTSTGSQFTGSGQVQFRDTGVTLTVTPRVNPGGLVFMEISQEVSEPGAKTDATGNVPVTKREIQTEVAVQSGQTVLLGGLMSETKTQGHSGVPGISEIPILRSLFGKTNRTEKRKELLVLIKPTVIRNEAEAAQVTADYQDQFRALEPLRKTPAEQPNAPKN